MEGRVFLAHPTPPLDHSITQPFPELPLDLPKLRKLVALDPDDALSRFALGKRLFDEHAAGGARPNCWSKRRSTWRSQTAQSRASGDLPRPRPGPGHPWPAGRRPARLPGRHPAHRRRRRRHGPRPRARDAETAGRPRSLARSRRVARPLSPVLGERGGEGPGARKDEGDGRMNLFPRHSSFRLGCPPRRS